MTTDVVLSNVSGMRLSTGDSLVHDVYDRSNRHIYRLLLMPITDIERDLRAARFRYFVNGLPQFGVVLRWSGDHCQTMSDWLAPMVGWIAEHAETPWSMQVNPVNVNEVGITFAFADDVTAVAFALVWR